jgi:hypothetical protein
MADIYSGYKRSLKCYVSKKLNGVEDVGYPKSYPTATDIANGYFTYNAIQYDIPTPTELSSMSQAAYDSLLATFKLYVESIESGASFTTDVIVDATLYDPSGCAVEIPTTTSTTTTTTTEIEPSASYGITSDGEGHGSTQTVFTVIGSMIGDIVTIDFEFIGNIQRLSGYSSTQAKLVIVYPGGTVQGLSTCFSDTAVHEVGIAKPISFIATESTFDIVTELSKINSLNIVGDFSCTISNVNRGGIDHPMSKIALGKFDSVLNSQFSC